MAVDMEEIQNVMDNFSPEELSEIKEAFALFDKDGDGSITVKELGTVMDALGQKPNEQELVKMVAEVDVDGNGEIDIFEFTYMLSKIMQQADSDTEIRETFKLFDKDGDGYLNSKDIKYFMAKLGEKITDTEAEQMVLMADKDKDGRISFEEFAIMMREPKSAK